MLCIRIVLLIIKVFLIYSTSIYKIQEKNFGTISLSKGIILYLNKPAYK